MHRKAAIFSLFFLKPLSRVAVCSGGIFRWSATIAAVGLFEGLKSSQWHWNTDCSERKKGFWRIWTVSASRFEAIFWWLRRI